MQIIVIFYYYVVYSILTNLTYWVTVINRKCTFYNLLPMYLTNYKNEKGFLQLNYFENVNILSGLCHSIRVVIN